MKVVSGATKGWSLTLLRFYAFLTFSSILKMPFGAPTNMRLKVFGRQRRSSVLRRVRVRSAIVKAPYGDAAAKRMILQHEAMSSNSHLIAHRLRGGDIRLERPPICELERC